MKKKNIIILSLILMFIVITFYVILIYFFPYFKPGKFGDLELKKDGTYTLNGCGFEKGTYEVSGNYITLFIESEQYKSEIFKIKIINVNKLQIIANGTNCRMYSNAIYKRG